MSLVVFTWSKECLCVCGLRCALLSKADRGCCLPMKVNLRRFIFMACVCEWVCLRETKHAKNQKRRSCFCFLLNDKPCISWSSLMIGQTSNACEKSVFTTMIVHCKNIHLFPSLSLYLMDSCQCFKDFNEKEEGVFDDRHNLVVDYWTCTRRCTYIFPQIAYEWIICSLLNLNRNESWRNNFLSLSFAGFYGMTKNLFTNDKWTTQRIW